MLIWRNLFEKELYKNCTGLNDGNHFCTVNESESILIYRNRGEDPAALLGGFILFHKRMKSIVNLSFDRLFLKNASGMEQGSGFPLLALRSHLLT
ncbi:hypothetical protein SAMN05443252_10871 [Bacillus sp. OV322]|nr:hypothetical protein SAMN05443252_10871 [Bacillus sp. OV322]